MTALSRMAIAGLIVIAGCSPSHSDQTTEVDAADPANANTVASPPATRANPPLPSVEPPAPGEPGGLPDDRTPVAEAPFSEASAQGAANVVQTYHALLGSRRYAEAWRLWSDGGRASGMSEADFARSFDKYAQYDAQIGAPGAIEGAAGSLYVEVPVVIYGRLKSGEQVHLEGPVTLRRVNDVPGSTGEQRRWHIASSGLKLRPSRR